MADLMKWAHYNNLNNFLMDGKPNRVAISHNGQSGYAEVELARNDNRIYVISD